MSGTQNFRDELFAGLKLLAADAFPKLCTNCGATYGALSDFISGTSPVGDGSGLASQEVADDACQVALARQCRCGAEMLEYLDDRRRCHDVASKRRDLFDRLLQLLTEGGMASCVAKTELLKIMRGKKVRS